MHEHRGALLEWLNDEWKAKNAEWYNELQRLAFEAFAAYGKTLKNPDALALIGGVSNQESDELLMATIKQSTMTDESVPTDFDEAEIAEAIRCSLETESGEALDESIPTALDADLLEAIRLSLE